MREEMREKMENTLNTDKVRFHRKLGIKCQISLKIVIIKNFNDKPHLKTVTVT